MNCNEIRKNISLYIDGVLSRETKTAFEEHLSKCKECPRILQETLCAVKAVSGSGVKQVPEGFYERLNRRLNGELEKDTELQPVFNWNYLMRGLATGFALLLVFVLVKEVRKEPEGLRRAVMPEVKEEVKLRKEAKKAQEPASMFMKGQKSDNPAKDSDTKPQEVKGIVSLEKKIPAPAAFKERTLKQESNIGGAVSSAENVPVDSFSDKKMKYSRDESAGNKLKEVQQYKSLGAEYKKPVSVQSVLPPGAVPEKESEPKEWLGYYSAYRISGTKVITDEAGWEKLWQEQTGSQVTMPELPKVDFNRETIVGVFMGEKHTGGYEIRITNVEKQNDKVIVSYKETVPGKGFAVIQVLTQPYHIKVIEKTNLPVVFQKIQ